MLRGWGAKDNRNYLKQVSTGFGDHVERPRGWTGLNRKIAPGSCARSQRPRRTTFAELLSSKRWERVWDLGESYRLDQTGVNFVNNPVDQNCRNNSGES